MSFRNCVKTLANFGLAVAMACPAMGRTQTYPTRPVTIVVPYSAGGPIDAILRPIADKLSKRWGQPVIIENKPGANGLIGTQWVVKSHADGYTLLHHITGVIQNPLLYRSAKYDPISDLAPLVQIGTQPMGLAVAASSPLQSLDQLVASGRSGSGQSYGTTGRGHTGHIWSELLTSEKKFSAVNVAYKGIPPLLTDLLTARLDWAFISSADVIARAQNNSLRALAVTGTRRLKRLPDVPTMTELGYPGFEMLGWHGLFAPAGTPAEVRRKIEYDVQAVLRERDIEQIAEVQAIDLTGIGEPEFAKIIKTDYGRWRTLIQGFGLQSD